MLFKVKSHIWSFLLLLSISALGQKSFPLNNDSSYEKAYQLAYDGKTGLAYEILDDLVKENPTNLKAKSLYASANSWYGNYKKARNEFNKILSKDKNNRNTWIASVKNELYAKKYAVALGLANKGLIYIKEDQELERLKKLAIDGVNSIEYEEKGWHNVESEVSIGSKKKASKVKNKAKDSVAIAETVSESPLNIEKEKNRIAINNSFTVFNERYDPITFSGISYMKKLKIGSIIPKINYSNRAGKNGIQYAVDFYPKITKGLYAYLNYGYSNSEIYPTHKMGGDLYLNLKKGYEFSAGGRFIKFPTRDLKVVTNSLGYYKGNYYFSLRSYITPLPDRLTTVSANLLVRKYLKDAENFFGVSGGFGFSPELRQFTSGEDILAETLLFIESQRFSCEYQFTTKNSPNVYRTNLGVTRQELAFAPGQYFWSFSGGLTYQVKF